MRSFLDYKLILIVFLCITMFFLYKELDSLTERIKKVEIVRDIELKKINSKDNFNNLLNNKKEEEFNNVEGYSNENYYSISQPVNNNNYQDVQFLDGIKNTDVNLINDQKIYNTQNSEPENNNEVVQLKENSKIKVSDIIKEINNPTIMTDINFQMNSVNDSETQSSIKTEDFNSVNLNSINLDDINLNTESDLNEENIVSDVDNENNNIITLGINDQNEQNYENDQKDENNENDENDENDDNDKVINFNSDNSIEEFSNDISEEINIYSNDNEDDNNTSLIESLEDMTIKSEELDITILLKNKLIELQNMASDLDIPIKTNSGKKKTKLNLAQDIISKKKYLN